MNKGVEKLYQVTNTDLSTKEDDNDLQYINVAKKEKKNSPLSFFDWLDLNLPRKKGKGFYTWLDEQLS